MTSLFQVYEEEALLAKQIRILEKQFIGRSFISIICSRNTAAEANYLA